MKRDRYSNAAAQARVMLDWQADEGAPTVAYIRNAGRTIKRLVAECRRLERLRDNWRELAERHPYRTASQDKE